MAEMVFVVARTETGGYRARALGEAIFTEADTLPALREMVADAVRCHFDDRELPGMIRLLTESEASTAGPPLRTALDHERAE
ncbi:hypothetical protein [Longimicrobium sp.]|jgi:hypothetical protein|uniref:hypothetical protein n=1 Tax=Longimicrobium sp. TaxID=2029185 RepID=UPI002F925FEB